VLAAQAVIDAQSPAFEIGEDAVGPGQHDMGGHAADNVRIVGNAGSGGISGPAVGLGGGAGSEMGLEEGVQAVGRVVGNCCRGMRPGAAPPSATSTAPTTRILP
jgi:hypothetical protein